MAFDSRRHNCRASYTICHERNESGIRKRLLKILASLRCVPQYSLVLCEAAEVSTLKLKKLIVNAIGIS